MKHPLPKPAKRPFFAVALGGGGARGMAHIGVLKVLEHEGLRPDLVVGTSVGALIGAIYCAGVPIREMEDVARKVKWGDMGSFAWRLTGVSSNMKMERWLKSFMPTRHFADLKIPLAICATDLVTGNNVEILQGDLFSAVRASCALPGIYEPVKLDGMLCADGGMVAYLPAPQAKQLGADVVLASDVRSETWLPEPPKNAYQVLVQAFSIVTYRASELSLKAADVVVVPDLKGIGWDEMSKAGVAMVAGEYAMKEKVAELRQKLNPGLWQKMKKAMT